MLRVPYFTFLFLTGVISFYGVSAGHRPMAVAQIKNDPRQSIAQTEMSPQKLNAIAPAAGK